MHKLLLPFALVLSTFVSFAQSVPNGDFENWTDNIGYTEPNGWKTLNSFALFGFPIVCEKAADAKSGNWALRASTKTYTNGFDGSTDTIPCYITLSFKSSLPNYLNGYYKSDVRGKDTASIYLMAPYQANSNVIVAQQIITGNTHDQYVPFSIPVYSYGLPLKDSIILAISTKITYLNSPYKQATPGTTITMDQLSFSDFPLALEEDATTETLVIAPNPNNGVFSLQAQNTIEDIMITNAEGRKIFTKNTIKQSSLIIDLSDQDKGCYFIQAFISGKIYSKKIVVF